MNTNQRTAALLAAVVFTLAPGLMPGAAQAGDGHDHGDAPATAAGPALPAVTAASELFELVGRLHADELSILIDRADSTEPVLGAELSVELDGRTVAAPFHTDQGHYSLNDAEVLARLRQPGSKSLVFTLLAGSDSDLLTGELDVHDEHAAVAPAAPAWQGFVRPAAAGFLAILIAVVVLRRLRGARQFRSGGAA